MTKKAGEEEKKKDSNFYFFVFAGDVLVALRCDLDGNVEVMIRNRPHLVPLNCVQPVPIDNPTPEQKQLLQEIHQRSKRLGTGSIKQVRRGGCQCDDAIV